MAVCLVQAYIFTLLPVLYIDGYGGQQVQYEAPDDRVQCQFCGRKFAEQAANRHIPHCETKHKNE